MQPPPRTSSANRPTPQRSATFHSLPRPLATLTAQSGIVTRKISKRLRNHAPPGKIVRKASGADHIAELLSSDLVIEAPVARPPPLVRAHTAGVNLNRKQSLLWLRNSLPQKRADAAVDELPALVSTPSPPRFVGRMAFA
jgi:hypothetical protein